MASAVGAPTGRRLRGGCEVGSWGEGIQWLDRLSGFDGPGTMEKGCGQGRLGRADDAFFGIKHEPSEASLESGWEIYK